MTTGPTIYLVSACASGEDFVAAFRRYADKNGLFVPIAEPIPAGRRGRFAVTLVGGGIMIEGDAEIVSSAPTPSVLHGRVGMTLRFVEPDIKSKTVLVELEQARLALKPQPPSVPPRGPASLPAEPRPVPPKPAGRIDANNAKAECVAIGDVEALEITTPQTKATPKFVVPTIPPVGSAPQRPRTPSTPPAAVARPLARPATPSTPPPATTVPVPPPRTTSPGVPVATKITDGDITAVSGSPVTPGSITAVSAPITPRGMAVAEPLTTPTHVAVPAPIGEPESDDGTPAGAPDDERRDTIAMPPLAVEAMIAAANAQLTPVPQARDAEVYEAQRGTSDTHPAVRLKNDSDTFPVTSVPTPPEAVPEPVAVSPSKPNGADKSNKAHLPPPRRTTNTNPPIPRNPTPAGVPALQLPRATPPSATPVTKPQVARPTRIGFPVVEPKAPAPASGQIPLPPVVAEAKPSIAHEVTDEPTDVSSIPIPPEAAPDPAAEAPAAADAPDTSAPLGGERKTAMGVAVAPDGVTVLPAQTSDPIALPTTDEERDTAQMDAKPSAPVVVPPVVEEPSGDWTMVPGDGGVTILPRAPEAGASAPPPADDQKLPTGDWTIARVEDSPDGWSEPSKVDAKPLKIDRRRNPRAHTGPPVAVVSGEKSLEVTVDSARAFEIEEETRSGLKIEVDESLTVEPGADVGLASTQFQTPAVPAGLATPIPGTLPAMSPMLPGMPPAHAIPPTPMAMAPPPHAMLPAMPVPPAQAMPVPQAMPPQAMPPMPVPPALPTPLPIQVPSNLFAPAQSVPGSGSLPGFPTPDRADLFATVHVRGEEHTAIVARRRRMTVIAASAGVLVIGGVVALVVSMGGGDGQRARTVAPAPTADAGIAVSPADAAAIDPDQSEPAIRPEVPGKCAVDVQSTPGGAEIYLDKELLGETPTQVHLPCGVEAKLTFKKNRYASTSKSVVPAERGSKVKATLAKPTFSVKVTSSPPGATITMNGKSLGVTPGVIKLPAFEASTLVFSKPGFAQDTQKFTPKQNNQSVHVALKKKGR